MRRCLYQLVIVAIVWAMFSAPGAALAGETVTLTVFSREWVPFEMVVDGRVEGVTLDLFKAVMPDGVDLAVEVLPAPRSVLHQRGAPVYTRLECRDWWTRDEAKYLWTDTVMTVKSVLYSPAGKPVDYVDTSSLHGLRIGCIRNYVYPEVEPLFAAGLAQRYDVNSDLLLLRMVKVGRVDVAVFDDLSAAWMIRRAPDMACKDFYVAKKPLGTAELQFVFNMVRDWKRHLPEINAKIRAAQANGTVDGILARYR